MIIIKDFEWTQSDEEIVIEVPFRNAVGAIDILTHENFIKIHAAPYYFEAFLLNRINEDESRCQLTKAGARFVLKKSESGVWASLEREFCDKAEKAKVKCEVLEKVQQRSAEKAKLRLEEKEKVKRSEVENAMEKDAKVREAVEAARKAAVEKGLGSVPAIKAEPEVAAKVSKKLSPKAPPEAPEVRKSATIEIKFSERNFVTPKRESQDPAEQEWLMRQAEARRVVGFVPEDLRPEERDPMYLKRKGDEFFRQQNYLAAISAYTTGIRLANKCYELYLNRSAAHLAQENYQRCAEDCTTALELLNPPVASNLKARTQALARRGAALSKLGFTRQAYGEFVAAVKLDPTDEMLKRDAEMLRAKLEANDDD